MAIRDCVTNAVKSEFVINFLKKKIATIKSMLFFFLRASATTLVVVGVIVAASLVVRNAWCRFLCPYGAFLGILALASPVAVRRTANHNLE